MAAQAAGYDPVVRRFAVSAGDDGVSACLGALAHAPRTDGEAVDLGDVAASIPAGLPRMSPAEAGFAPADLAKPSAPTSKKKKSSSS